MCGNFQFLFWIMNGEVSWKHGYLTGREGILTLEKEHRFHGGEVFPICLTNYTFPQHKPEYIWKLNQQNAWHRDWHGTQLEMDKK